MSGLRHSSNFLSFVCKEKELVAYFVIYLHKQFQGKSSFFAATVCSMFKIFLELLLSYIPISYSFLEKNVFHDS